MNVINVIIVTDVMMGVRLNKFSDQCNIILINEKNYVDGRSVTVKQSNC